MSEQTTRQARKARTRRALLAAGLQLSEAAGLASVSLRQVAKDVGLVPTAFYRHFESMDDLGLVLVDESFVSLRALLRDVRDADDLRGLIPRSVEVLVDHVRAEQAHFRFIVRERHGGSPEIRAAIARELDLCAEELAEDLHSLPGASSWSRADVRVACLLVVDAMVVTVERLVAADKPGRIDEIAAEARTQLRMFVLGVANWKSR